MTVIYNNERYQTDLSFNLLENLKKIMPDMSVTITTDNGSSYKKVLSVPVKELEDWSIVRNMEALTSH